jgi:acetylornithine deacetylase/succinyl-diaminopimelate desuccinylase-like protein
MTSIDPARAGWLVTACAALLALFSAPRPICAASREPDWRRALPEYRQLLGDLVAIDSSNPPGNELAVAARLRALLEKEGIACDTFQTAPGRGNLVARLTGSGRKRPLLLLGHIDVVGVQKDKWTTDPFTLTERDGHLYGRGVIDDKGMVAAEALAMVWLARLKVPLDRDVILLAECDEESGGEMGVEWMLAHHRDAIDAEFALNEGGRTSLANGGVLRWMGIQTSEKRPVNFTLRAHGTSGHASMPRRDNCIAALGRALAKFAAPVFPVVLTSDTRAFFPAIAAREPDTATAYAMRHLDRADSAGAYGAIVGRDIMFDSMLRTSVSPTIVTGGFRSNVIPSSAEATLNVRMLPGTNPDSVQAALRRIVDDPQIEVTYTPPTRPEAPSVPFAGAVVDAVRKVCATMAPGVPVVPLLSTGATDSAQLRREGIAAYGLLPFPLTTEDIGGMHGDNERMPLASLGFGLKMMYRVTLAIAGR